MPYKTSCFNKTIFKKNITHFWPIWAIWLVVQILVLPVNIFLLTGDDYLRRIGDGENIAQIKMQNYINALDIATEPILVFIAALICAMAVFYYLYQSRSCNMMHALPVSRKELFVTNYLSGLLFLMIPQAISFLISIFVCLGRNITDLKYLLWSFLMILGMAFFAYNFAIFVGMLTGQFVIMPIFFFLLNFLVLGIRMILEGIIMQSVYGMRMVYEMGKEEVLSPLYYLTRKVSLVLNYSEGGDAYQIVVTGGKEIAWYAVAAVVFLVLSYICYKKKQIETVGDFIVISWIKPIFRWGAVLCGSGVAVILGNEIVENMVGGNSILPGVVCAVIVGAIVFFLAEMLLEKKFKVFSKKRLLECCGVLGISLMILCAVQMDVMGFEKKIPETSQIKQAYILMDIYVEGDEKEEINEIREIHQMLLQEKEVIQEAVKDETDTMYVTLCYIMKDGSKQERTYEIPCTEKYYNQNDSVLRKIVEKENQYENYMKGTFGKNYKESVPVAASIDMFHPENDTQENINLGSETAAKLYEAIQADAKEGNLKVMPYELGQKENYYNAIYIEFYNPKGYQSVFPEEAYDDIYAYESEGSRGAYIEFSKDCSHILEVLQQADIFNENYKLITYEEFNREIDKQ